MPAPRRPKKPPAPVHGKARWIKRPASPRHAGRLEITNGNGQAQEYDVVPIISGETLVGYLLFKDRTTSYAIDVTVNPWTCECGDYVFRREGSETPECKHVAGLRVALAAL